MILRLCFNECADGEGDIDAFLGKSIENSFAEGETGLLVILGLAPRADPQIQRAVAEAQEEHGRFGLVDQQGLFLDDAYEYLSHVLQVARVVYSQVKIAAAQRIARHVHHRGFDEHFAGNPDPRVIRLPQGDGKEVYCFHGAGDSAGGHIVADADALLAHDEDAADEVAEGGLRGKADGDTGHARRTQHADEVYPDCPLGMHHHKHPEQCEQRLLYQRAHLAG